MPCIRPCFLSFSPYRSKVLAALCIFLENYHKRPGNLFENKQIRSSDSTHPQSSFEQYFNHLLTTSSIMSLFCLSAVVVLSLLMASASLATASNTAAKPRLVYRVTCPNDRMLRKMITTRAEVEDFIVECSNAKLNSPMEGTIILTGSCLVRCVFLNQWRRLHDLFLFTSMSFGCFNISGPYGATGALCCVRACFIDSQACQFRL